MYQIVLRIILFLTYPLALSSDAIVRASYQFGREQAYQIWERQHCVGWLAGYEFPEISVVVLHSVYVLPEYRGHGYARFALSSVLDHYQNRHFHNAYVQVGPYEKDEQLCKDSADYAERLGQLRSFYQKLGFNSASRWEQALATLCYPLVGLDLDAQYLLKADLSQRENSLEGIMGG